MNRITSLIAVITTALALALPANGQSFLTNGLVAYYPLAGNANDASGFGHNAVITGPAVTSATNQAGLAAGALHFGGGSHLSVTPTPFAVNSPWTISLFVRLDSAPPGSVYNFFSTGQDAANGINLRYVASNLASPWEFAVFGFNNAGDCAATNVPTGWTMATCVRNGTLFQMYLNGALVINTNVASTLYDAGSFSIGAHAYAPFPYYMVGSMSDVRVYNRGLSGDEVAQLYAYQSAPPPCVPYNAAGTARVDGGFVVGLTLTDSGCGYTNAPLVLIAGGGGTGATATATVTNGQVVGLNITSPGAGYTSTPQVIFESPLGPVPQIIQQPQGLTVTNGSPATFSVAVWGQAPLSYQWEKNGANLSDGGVISGSAAATLSLGNTTIGDGGAYRVVVTDAYGSVTSSPATLTVIGAPFISAQPQNQTVPAGSNAVLSVSVLGVGPMSFQWSFDGTNLVGDTSATLTLTNVQFAQGGTYAVAIANAAGYAVSSNATLTVLSAPQILAQPVGAVGYWGGAAAFQVIAQGTLPLSYQWYFDTLPISWATNAILILTNLDLTQAGTYSVQVTNLYGGVLSTPANLVVNPAGVSLGLYGGLTITGTVGKSFGIQYTLSTAGTPTWTTLTNLTLAQPVQLWVDTSVNVNQQGQRFYRVVPLP